jgi:tetratricopeptide (TPR) repeat protein
MEKRTSRVKNDVQDRNSDAWKKLCDYIDQIAETGNDEFAPREILGELHFSKIYTLPESIAKLKKVKKVWLYGLHGQYDQAIADYTKAIELNPRDADAYYNRGNAYETNRNMKMACSDWRKACKSGNCSNWDS